MADFTQDLDASDTPVTDETETPEAVATEAAAGEAAAKVETKPDESERVIELSRKARDFESKAVGHEKRAAAAEARVKQLEPVVELFKLAETDPLAFVTEIADIVGLSPERTLDLIQKHGAGADETLSAEDRLAILERRLAEGTTEKPEADNKAESKPEDAEQAREGFITGLKATVEAAPEVFPLCSQEPAAPEAAFLIMVRHWEANSKLADGNPNPAYRPMAFNAALLAVEKTLRKGKSASESSGNGNMSPPSTGGLSKSQMGAVVPAPVHVLSDEEIAEQMHRELFGG